MDLSNYRGRNFGFLLFSLLILIMVVICIYALFECKHSVMSCHALQTGQTPSLFYGLYLGVVFSILMFFVIYVIMIARDKGGLK